MAIEIERKFLVDLEKWQLPANNAGVSCRQSCLVAKIDKVIRIRIIGNRGYVTLKGAMKGISRPEFEYEIPIAEAEEILLLFGERQVEKTRYLVKHAGKDWEVDVFHGDNQGLILAEVELESEDEPVKLPEWVGEEVSIDPRYLNVNLQERPFSTW